MLAGVKELKEPFWNTLEIKRFNKLSYICVCNCSLKSMYTRILQTLVKGGGSKMVKIISSVREMLQEV